MTPQETDARVALWQRYFAGTLPEQEQQRLEESYFGDDDAFEELRAAQAEWCDRHLGRPAGSWLASGEGRARLRFARALQRRLDRDRRTSRTASVRVWLLAASALLAVGMTTAVGMLALLRRDEPRAARGPQARPVGEPTSRAPAAAAPRTLLLSNRLDDVLESPRPTGLPVQAEVVPLRIQLFGHDPFAAYSAALFAPDGTPVLLWPHQPAERGELGPVLRLDLPVRHIRAAGPHTLRVNGLLSDGSLREVGAFFLTLPKP